MIKLTALVATVLFAFGGVPTADASVSDTRSVVSITAAGGIQVGSGDLAP